MIDKHPNLLKALEVARERLEHHFGDASVVLSPRGEDGVVDGLWLRVSLPKSQPNGLALLDRFDDEWLASASGEALELLSFNLTYV